MHDEFRLRLVKSCGTHSSCIAGQGNGQFHFTRYDNKLFTLADALRLGMTFQGRHQDIFYNRKMPNNSEISFLCKLWEMLHQQQNCQFASWNTNGTSFSIRPTGQLTQTNLTKCFSQRNFPSFRRRLRSLGFEESTLTPQGTWFSHAHFLRQSRESIASIVPKSAKPKSFAPFQSQAQTQALELIGKAVATRQDLIQAGVRHQLLCAKITKFITSFQSEVIKIDIRQPNPVFQVTFVAELLSDILGNNKDSNQSVMDRLRFNVVEVLRNADQNVGLLKQGLTAQKDTSNQ